MDGKELRAKCYGMLNRHAKKGAIVLAGSSLCEQFPVNEMLMSRGENITVYNRGISGDTIPGYRAKLQECVYDLEPKKLFINIGTNDLNGGKTTGAQIVEMYSALLAEIIGRLPETEIFVLSYYPINEQVHATCPWQSGRTNAQIAEVNVAVEKMAKDMGLTWIDVSAAVSDEQGSLRAEWATDGLHMYPEAYERVLDVLLPYMR